MIARTAKAQKSHPGDEPPDGRRIVRNLVFYTIGVLILSVVGGIVTGRGIEAGALIFLIGPLLMTVLLRTLGGDGWADAGMRLGPRRWHLFGLLIFPLTFFAILAIGALFGAISLAGTFGAFLAAVAIEVVPRLLFSGFEEIGWRGYLEPRLAALGIPDLRRHLMVGLLWTVWHVPYVVNVADYTDVSLPIFIPLFVAGVLAMALVYGQLRKQSGSVWPVVLAHGVGNALAFPLVFGDFAEFKNPALLATRPESLLFVALWGAIGWRMLRRSQTWTRS